MKIFKIFLETLPNRRSIEIYLKPKGQGNARSLEIDAEYENIGGHKGESHPPQEI